MAQSARRERVDCQALRYELAAAQPTGTNMPEERGAPPTGSSSGGREAARPARNGGRSGSAGLSVRLPFPGPSLGGSPSPPDHHVSKACATPPKRAARKPSTARREAPPAQRESLVCRHFTPAVAAPSRPSAEIWRTARAEPRLAISGIPHGSRGFSPSHWGNSPNRLARGRRAMYGGAWVPNDPGDQWALRPPRREADRKGRRLPPGRTAASSRTRCAGGRAATPGGVFATKHLAHSRA